MSSQAGYCYWIDPGSNDCQDAGPGAGAGLSGVLRGWLCAEGSWRRRVAAGDGGGEAVRGIADGASVASSLPVSATSGFGIAFVDSSRICVPGNGDAPFSAASSGRFGP